MFFPFQAQLFKEPALSKRLTRLVSMLTASVSKVSWLAHSRSKGKCPRCLGCFFFRFQAQLFKEPALSKRLTRLVSMLTASVSKVSWSPTVEVRERCPRCLGSFFFQCLAQLLKELSLSKRLPRFASVLRRSMSKVSWLARSRSKGKVSKVSWLLRLMSFLSEALGFSKGRRV